MTQARLNKRQLTALNTLSEEHRVRALMGQLSGGGMVGDTLHDIYADFGYPSQLQFLLFWNMYRRFGIATAVVDLIPDEGWRDTPIIEADDAWLREFERLTKRVKLWSRLKAVDKRQRVGRYAGLYMRVKDGKQPSEPLEGRLSGENSLFQIVPLYEGELKVLETDTNTASERYGLPTMYQYNTGNPSNRNERNGDNVSIHPSRIVIAAEGADNGGIYGVPALEGSYNSLMDLQKIVGAGGEGFYRNAAQSLVFSLKDTAEIADVAPLLEEFNDQADEFTRNRQRRSLWTPNMDAKTLDSALANPKEFFMNSLNVVAASSGIPATVLIGQQTGRLASTEDGKRLLRMIQSRRESFQDDLTRDVIDWCIKYGILPSASYEIEWPDVMAPSDEDKLANAEKMAEINHKLFMSGSGNAFEAEEIREAAGYEPDVMPEEGEELPEGDED